MALFSLICSVHQAPKLDRRRWLGDSSHRLNKAGKRTKHTLRIYSIYIYPPSFDAHEIHSDTRLAWVPKHKI